MFSLETWPFKATKAGKKAGIQVDVFLLSVCRLGEWFCFFCCCAEWVRVGDVIAGPRLRKFKILQSNFRKEKENQVAFRIEAVPLTFSGFK